MAAIRLRLEAEVSEWSDAELVRAGSTGDRGVFAELYRRHSGVARDVARSVAANDDDAADAAAEAFARVFDAVVSGRTPSMEFRAYLITATRNAAIDQRRRAGRRPEARRLGASDDEGPSDDGRLNGPGPSDSLAASEDSKLVTAAFQTLPARWQSVLWLTEVEGIPAREAAGVLGISPNNVAQLAVRARARLRARYLQAHVRNHAQPLCQETVEQLGAYLAGTLAAGRRTRVDTHLRGCPACGERLAEVEDLGVPLRKALVPVPLLAAGWLRRRPRHHRMQLAAMDSGIRPAAEVSATSPGPAAGASIAVSRSTLFRILALMPVSAVAVLAAAGSTIRFAIKAVVAVLASLPLVSGIGGTDRSPAAVAVKSAVQPSGRPAVITPPPTVPAPSPPPPVLATPDPGPLPVTAHPTTSVAQAVGPSIDVFDYDGVSVVQAFDNPQPSGAPPVFVVVEQQGDWLRVQTPARPNGRTGWVRRQDVSLSTHAFSIVVELAVHRITVFNGSEPFLSEPVGVGTSATPTPLGLYFTKELIGPENPSGLIRPGGPYGPYAVGLSAFSDVLTDFGGGDGVVGLHGTNDPGGLGTDISHGCIRMSNAGITTLAGILPLGVPIDIRP